jgi:hypothetical protein
VRQRHIVLDTGVLGLIVHPSKKPEPRECKNWLLALMTQDLFYIPEICDYELRRELLRMGFGDSISRLDGLKKVARLRTTHYGCDAEGRGTLG